LRQDRGTQREIAQHFAVGDRPQPSLGAGAARPQRGRNARELASFAPPRHARRGSAGADDEVRVGGKVAREQLLQEVTGSPDAEAHVPGEPGAQRRQAGLQLERPHRRVAGGGPSPEDYAAKSRSFGDFAGRPVLDDNSRPGSPSGKRLEHIREASRPLSGCADENLQSVQLLWQPVHL
jgi:hypothetical protein